MEPAPAPSSTSGWWFAWLAGVLGGPGLGCAIAALDKKGDIALLGLLLTLLAGLGLHMVATVKLANRIAAAREDPARRRATGGLVVGLLFGGWAVMFAIFFVGCLAALTGNIGR